jgi:hypothetical protein
MQRTPVGIIRKVIVGDNPKSEGMSYQVGHPMGNLFVTEILEDVNHFHIFGRIRFLIYVRKPNESASILWKALEGVPLTIEYDISKNEILV